MVWLGHGVSVDHLSDQLHCVVQELSSLDVSPGAGFCLFELGQEVVGSQSPFRQRHLHSGKENGTVSSSISWQIMILMYLIFYLRYVWDQHLLPVRSKSRSGQ